MDEGMIENGVRLEFRKFESDRLTPFGPLTFFVIQVSKGRHLVETIAMALLKGTLDLLVLKALSWGPMHGFEITSWLEERSGGRLMVEDAALLQALHRMEERRLLAAEWGVTKNARRARYYRLTAAGRSYLRTEAEKLVDHVDALTTVLTASRA